MRVLSGKIEYDKIHMALQLKLYLDGIDTQVRVNLEQPHNQDNVDLIESMIGTLVNELDERCCLTKKEKIFYIINFMDLVELNL